jgi:hypothetical protein
MQRRGKGIHENARKGVLLTSTCVRFPFQGSGYGFFLRRRLQVGELNLVIA